MEKNRTKALVRRVMRDRVRQNEDRCPKDLHLMLAVEKWPIKWQDRLQNATVVAAYMPMFDELSLEAFWRVPELASSKKCFPRVEGDQIVFYAVSDQKQLQVGSFGIWEPFADAERIDPKSIDLMLIPASAYGCDGTRLGRGKGFYDRYFVAMMETRKRSDFALVGVVPSSGFLKQIPSDPWDLKVDAVVTESQFVEIP